MSAIDYTINYRKWHPATPEHAAAMELYFARSLREFLPKVQSSPILEIGCGTGYAMAALAGAGYGNVIGIDADPGQIETARGKGLDARLVPLTEYQEFVSRHAAAFDFIFAFDVIEHVPIDEQIGFVRGIGSMLKPGGAFVCQVPNAVSPLASYMRYNDWTHHASFTVDSLEFLLKNCGLVPDVVRGSVDPHPVRTSLAAAAARILRGGFKCVVRGWWRAVLLSEAGVGVALSHPVTPNLVMRARRASAP